SNDIDFIFFMYFVLFFLFIVFFLFFFFFFFQAEDGIRDFHVTGVQTCALPIWVVRQGLHGVGVEESALLRALALQVRRGDRNPRSEERRVGKECRSRWWRDH